MEDQVFHLWYFLNCETVFKDGTHQKANANKNKHQDIEVEIAKKVYEDVDKPFIDSINELDSKLIAKMDDYQVSDALTEIMNVLRASNKYIDDTTPWILAKDEAKKDRLETVIYNLLEAIRVCALLLEPFITNTSKEILKQINNDVTEFKYVEDNEYKLGQPEVLFQRIDKDKFLQDM